VLHSYKVRKARKSKVGMSDAEMNFGRFYVTDATTTVVVAAHFNTFEAAKEWVRKAKQADKLATS